MAKLESEDFRPPWEYNRLKFRYETNGDTYVLDYSSKMDLPVGFPAQVEYRSDDPRKARIIRHHSIPYRDSLSIEYLNKKVVIRYADR